MLSFRQGNPASRPSSAKPFRTLEAHELVKIKLLKNCFDDVRGAGETLAGRTRSELVKVIGRTLILYRPSKEHKRIELP